MEPSTVRIWQYFYTDTEICLRLLHSLQSMLLLSFVLHPRYFTALVKYYYFSGFRWFEGHVCKSQKYNMQWLVLSLA